MDAIQFGCSSCRYCRHYTPEGRRGGHCSQLDVPVRSRWAACPLSTPVFAETLQPMGNLPLWAEEFVLAHREGAIADSDYATIRL